MAVIIPFRPKRCDSTAFTEEPLADMGLTPRFRIKQDAEGSGYKIVEMLLPPAAAMSAVQEMMQRYMVQPQPKRRERRRV